MQLLWWRLQRRRNHSIFGRNTRMLSEAVESSPSPCKLDHGGLEPNAVAIYEEVMYRMLPLIHSSHKRCTSLPSWWLNQPIWKICSSNWIISPGIGVKIKKIELPPPSYNKVLWVADLTGCLPCLPFFYTSEVCLTTSSTPPFSKGNHFFRGK